ncbi:MAG: cation transporter [Phycisphaerales bacterium]|nr:cation transporter [Phycisphaerales bacterium]
MTPTPSPERLTPTGAPTVTFAIDGMSCGHCVGNVTRALEATPGIAVRSVAVGTAKVEADSPAATAGALAAIEAAGYTATVAASAPPKTHSGCGCCGTSKAAGPSA